MVKRAVALKHFLNKYFADNAHCVSNLSLKLLVVICCYVCFYICYLKLSKQTKFADFTLPQKNKYKLTFFQKASF